MSYQISENCVACSACLLRCPFDAIYLTETKCMIDSDKCISCGCCTSECPIDAITPDIDTIETLNAAGGKITRVEIVDKKCIGCSICKKACPVNAISGVLKQPFYIDQDICIQCGKCIEKCRKDAFYVRRIMLK